MCPLTSEPQVLISHAPTPDTLGHRTPDPPEGLPGLCRVITSEPFWTAQKQSAGQLKRRQTGSTLTCPSPTGASESDQGGRGQLFRFSLEGPALGKCQMFAGYMKYLVLLPRENCI